MRRWVSLAVLVAAGALPLEGQRRLEGRVDPQTLAALRPVLEQGQRDSVPIAALEDKALEGAAKRVPPERIVAAVRQLEAELRAARALLRAARPNARIADVEMIAAADSRRRAVPSAEIATLAERIPVTTGLFVPLTVLGDLVQRGVPAAEARRVLVELLANGVSPEQLAEIPGRVDVALRVGAPPLEAFHSALPIPVRPPVPQTPTGPPTPVPTPPTLLQ